MTTFGDVVYQMGGVPVGGNIGLGDGKVFWRDASGGSDSNSGLTPTEAKATMAAAHALCVSGRGDTILCLPGGEEVTSTLVFNKANVRVIAVHAANRLARGEYVSMYAGASFTDGPVAQVTAGGVAFEGIGFVSRDTGATFYDGAALLLGGLATAAPFGTHILNCRFPKWNLSNRIGIAIEGGSDILIEECSFEGVGSDFASGIYVQGAVQNLEVRGCRFRDCTNAITHGAFAGGGPHCIYIDNVVEDGKMLNSGSNTATGLITTNHLELAVGTASFDVNYAALAALGLYCSGNYYAEVD